jgi:hypothetical protein
MVGRGPERARERGSGSGFSYLFDLAGSLRGESCRWPPRVIGAWGRFWPGTALGDAARLWGLPRPGLAQDDRGHLISCAAGAGYDINRVPMEVAVTSSARAGGRPAGQCDGSSLGVSDSVDAEHVVDGLAGRRRLPWLRIDDPDDRDDLGGLRSWRFSCLGDEVLDAAGHAGGERHVGGAVGVFDHPLGDHGNQPCGPHGNQPCGGIGRDWPGLRFSFVRSSSVPRSASARTGLCSPGRDVLRLGRGVRAGRAHWQLCAGRGRRGLGPGPLWLRVSARCL